MLGTSLLWRSTVAFTYLKVKSAKCLCLLPVVLVLVLVLRIWPCLHDWLLQHEIFWNKTYSDFACYNRNAFHGELFTSQRMLDRTNNNDCKKCEIISEINHRNQLFLWTPVRARPIYAMLSCCPCTSTGVRLSPHPDSVYTITPER